MRILLINDYGTASGGAERQMIALRAGLRARGHAARLLTSDAVQVPGWPIEADVTCRGTTGRARAYLESYNPFAAAVLARELRDHPPDVVHIRMFLTQMSPAILPLLQNIPTLYQAVYYKAVCPNGLKLLPDGSDCPHLPGRICLTERCVSFPSWLSLMSQQRRIHRHWDKIDHAVALSHEMATMFRAHGLGEFGVIPNGVAERPPRPPLGNNPMIAYAGRLSREKGVDVLLEAFAHALKAVPAARLLIAGSGPDDAALRRRATTLGIGPAVEFLGYLAQDAMERIFEAAWVQVVPSIWREPFGNVATEAMMRGTAVIASDVGGLGETILNNETGLLVPPGDIVALAGAIETLLGDRTLADTLGRAGRARALAHFSQDGILARFEAIYHSILEKHAPIAAK